jgi:hypothetical protein
MCHVLRCGWTRLSPRRLTAHPPACSGTFDFFYLPIDFRNRCNLGYCFINFLDAATAGRLYRQYHNKRWEEYNSKKVRSVAAAAADVCVPVGGEGARASGARTAQPRPCRASQGFVPAATSPASGTLAVLCAPALPATSCSPCSCPQVCEITYGRVQGRDTLIQHFRASKFPCDDIEFMPLVFTRVEAGVASHPLAIHDYLASCGAQEEGEPQAQAHVGEQ